MVTGVAIIALIVLQLLLLARLSFQMAEANPQNDFVDAVYDTSDPFVEPFEDILTVETLDDGGIFDPNILIAMGVYLVAAVIVLALLWALVSPIATDRVDRVDTTRGTHQH
jgi:ABC-type Na+ efflux pump permease subunit